MANEAECRGKGWVERDLERVAHSEEYLRHAVDASGLLLRSLQVVSVRTEAHTPLQGHLCVVQRQGQSDAANAAVKKSP